MSSTSTEARRPDNRGRVPWNKGKLVGQKPPLKLKEIWRVRFLLQQLGVARDLALFDLAIDSKLRGCDLVNLKVDDVAVGGRVKPRAVARQLKTGHPVQFELTEQTREAVTAWIQEGQRRSGDPPLSQSAALREAADHPPVRSAGAGLARCRRHGRDRLRHAFFAADEADADLPPHRQPAGGAVAARPPQDREHRPLPRR